MKQVYLAGPITGLDYNGATEWRDSVVRQLAEAGIEGRSPMRGKQYLANLKKISSTGEEYVHMGVLSTPKGVITRDRFDCTTCDVLLVNVLGAQAVSIGTMIEIGWADAHRIPIIVVMEKENPHQHMMVWECAGFTVSTLDEAVHLTKIILA